jgi:hypothetical protein
MTLILAAQGIALAGGLGYRVDRSAALAAVIGLILLYRANLLPKSRPAWFNGVALPVLAGNSEVWRRVHRASAFRLIAIAPAALTLSFGPGSVRRAGKGDVEGHLPKGGLSPFRGKAAALPALAAP